MRERVDGHAGRPGPVEAPRADCGWEAEYATESVADAAGPLRALLLIPTLDTGGPDRVFAILAKQLPRFGIQTNVLTQYKGGRYWDQIAQQHAIRAMVDVRAGTSKNSYPVWPYVREIRKLRPDVVLTTLQGIMTAGVARMLCMTRVPLVVRPANHVTQSARVLRAKSPVKHSLSWALNVAALHSADAVVCQSEDISQDLRRYKLPVSKLHLIGNPIAVSPTISTDRVVARLPGSPCILAVGRLEPQKGFDLLVRAVALIRERLPGMHVHVLGEGRQRQDLEKLIADLDLQEKITLHGHREGVADYFAQADFTVSASRYEGFPNAILEALTCGIPVVARDCPGGTRDLVVDGFTGWLCSDSSVEALAKGIVTATEEHDSLPAPRIKEFVEQRYGVDQIVSRYAKVLKGVVHK